MYDEWKGKNNDEGAVGELDNIEHVKFMVI